MLGNIKSTYFTKIIFSYTEERIKLEIIKYNKYIILILIFFVLIKNMQRNFQSECNHRIKDNYYCEICGTLCYNNVNNIFYNSYIIPFFI